MYKEFTTFILENHPDPDALLENKFVFKEMRKLAEEYKNEQLRLHNVVKQYTEN